MDTLWAYTFGHIGSRSAVIRTTDFDYMVLGKSTEIPANTKQSQCQHDENPGNDKVKDGRGVERSELATGQHGKKTEPPVGQCDP